MRAPILAIGFILAALAPAPAAAQATEADFGRFGGSQGAEAAIASCTRLLQSGRIDDHDTTLAFFHRGVAHQDLGRHEQAIRMDRTMPMPISTAASSASTRTNSCAPSRTATRSSG